MTSIDFSTSPISSRSSAAISSFRVELFVLAAFEDRAALAGC